MFLLFNFFKQWTLIRKDDLDKLKVSLSSQDIKIENLNRQKIILENQLEYNKQNLQLIKELESQFPNAKITYRCRPLPNSKVNIPVPLNVFITPDDPFIIRELMEWGLYKTNENRETLVPKIYRKIFEKYKYAFDENNFGIPEIYLFPFEVREKKTADCEDWAHVIASYIESAGIHPAYCRVVAGDTNIVVNGKVMGHGTVYVHSFKDNKFHHINSTYGSAIPDDLSEFPTHDDAKSGKDKIGIKTVWFSYNSKTCYYNFQEEYVNDVIKKYNIIH